MYARGHFGCADAAAVSSLPGCSTCVLWGAMAGEGVFAGDWQRRQASRLDDTVRQFRAPESASSSGWAASAAPSEWHSQESMQAEFGNMRIAGAQPGAFSPERYVQYIRGRPVVVFRIEAMAHSYGSSLLRNMAAPHCPIIVVPHYVMCMYVSGLLYCHMKRHLFHSNVSSSPVAFLFTHVALC